MNKNVKTLDIIEDLQLFKIKEKKPTLLENVDTTGLNKLQKKKLKKKLKKQLCQDTT